jgi:hypothetical protein
MKHLWETDHPYYCNEGNYYAHESVGDEHKSFGEFIAEYANADFDLNLVFRWDWDERDAETEQSTFTGDVNYRNGVLKIFWMGQRKGLYRYSIVEVCRADETAVIAFLKPRWEYMQKLWEGIS